MEPFDTIEKLITEHGSAAILREHIQLLKSQMLQKDVQIEDQARLLKEKDAVIGQLQTQKPADACPFCRRFTGELIDIKPCTNGQLARVGFTQHYYKCSNPSCGKSYDKQVKP
jgi:hypothetical protein